MSVFKRVLLFSLGILCVQGYIAVHGNPLATYEQNHAQSVCVSLAASYEEFGWVSAVPRNCRGTHTCEEVCSHIKERAPDGQRRGAKTNICLDSLHIYKPQYSTKYGYPGLKTYVYNSCAGSSCGPNFCCCLSNP